MRALPLTVTALAAALALTACDNGGSGGDKNGSACEIGDLSVQVGPASVAPAAGDTGEVPVSITNQTAACTLDRFPRVLLESGRTETPLSPQQGAKPQKIELAKGDSASFTITYVRGAAGDGSSLEATAVKIAFPGSDTTRAYPWKYGPVAGKGAADKPDASVSAFQRAGD